MRESLRELGDWVCCSRLSAVFDFFWVFKVSYITHHCLPLVIWAAFVFTGPWFEDVPELLDL